ncbi:response regulator [Deinococcus hopiensis]|jgi:CheY-like chemotaxis protein|uniref:Response regulator containing a CheY-like receiver domain and an HTH DNA-binding domain n=1 Tax=Deinococcus hopiensis KR-140 TaxID=695939 RepID=A0A1W1V745_9DEIO|nr:response regulator [Deinococcus hopiensis]SMB89096.1 Response regulator containing a CheY-like receiver domain and an HTH DNA-binding domain [Deinococcus hopiensis KR-140]
MTRPLRLLVIDDSAMDRQLAEEVFGEYPERCTVTTAASGRAALDTMLTPGATLPDVVLLDINMPGLSGFDVLNTMKSHPQLQRIPVVMLSTSSQEQDVTQAYALHASSYLIKSVNFEDFVAQVEGFLEFWSNARLTNWPGSS